MNQKKDSLYSGSYAAYVLGYNDKLSDGFFKRREENEKKKLRELGKIKAARAQKGAAHV